MRDLELFVLQAELLCKCRTFLLPFQTSHAAIQRISEIVAGRNVEHNGAEPEQPVVVQTIDRDFPGVLLPEGAEILIGDAQRVVLAVAALIASRQEAFVDPSLDRLSAAA